RLRMCAVAIDAKVRQRERAEQPAPYRTLVIGGVPPAQIAAIPPGIARVTRREAAHSDRRQQRPRASVHDRPGTLRIQQAGAERYRENLIWPQAGILPPAARPGDA